MQADYLLLFYKAPQTEDLYIMSGRKYERINQIEQHEGGQKKRT